MHPITLNGVGNKTGARGYRTCVVCGDTKAEGQFRAHASGRRDKTCRQCCTKRDANQRRERRYLRRHGAYLGRERVSVEWDVIRRAYAITQAEEALLDQARERYGKANPCCNDIISAQVPDERRQCELLMALAYRIDYERQVAKGEAA